MRIRYHFLVLATFSFVFFARSFSSYFVCDDYEFLGRINFSNAPIYFTQSWGYGNEYRPLIPYSYALDALISGRSPVGYHITNTSLHIASALLVGIIAISMGLPKNVSLLASWIYLLNPVSHEAFLWIAGRPVVLSTFFILSSIALFLRAANSSNHRRLLWVASVGFLLFGLGTYELAIVTPLLIGLLCWIRGVPVRNYRAPLAVFLVICAIYAVFWNFFFDFQFTRITIERSPLVSIANFKQAILNSFHGSLRWLFAPVYIWLLGALAWSRRGRSAIFLTFCWLVISYLPFFAVHGGYADRFGYLASAGTATLVAIAILQNWPHRRRVTILLILVFLCYFGTGMQNRISAWKEAGELARRITTEIKQQLPDYPADREVVFLNIPEMHRGAYVFLTGFSRALQLEYPGAKIHFASSALPDSNDNAIVFEYSNLHIARR